MPGGLNMNPLTVTPTTSGLSSYTVTGVDGNGCKQSTNLQLNVWPLPQISVSVNPNDTICVGTMVTLTATGGNLVQWIPSTVLNGSAFMPQAGLNTYTVYVTDVNSCESSTTQSVLVNPLPSVPVITFTPNVLQSTPAVAYQWYLNGNIIPGATGQQLTITQNGSYTVVIRDANGCERESDPFVVTKLSVSDLQTLQGIRFYPNPAKQGFWLDIDQANGNVELEILSASGQKVYHTRLSEQHNYISLSVASGIYFLRVQTPMGSYISKIIKE